ncbi:autophagy-related protein 2 [Typha angustifolia]|uniref:autophagy-related protein 2 n=1 Tax=Typha angustifolia TaxID=59011 RepID=UPI003C2D9402
MGFPWNFPGKTLIKRLFKSLLKKKLGDLILGDIDLDQLDVQLSHGTIQLSDLALNADFINQKLAGAAIMVKEGSLKSLSIRIPFKLNSCEIKVEEFELVLAPYVPNEVPPLDADCLISANEDQSHEVVDTQKNAHGTENCNSAAVSRDVNEGVKKIANAVKSFLTSFDVRITDVYVVFDPHTNLDVGTSMFNRSLVLRIRETEFGTCLSEDAVVKLNNFIKFKEASVEFLQMDDVDAELQNNLETSTAGSCSGEGTTTILTGPIGGFSGTLNLSIPWKNGSLNLQKIDADVSIDPLELRVQPSSIQWFIAIWDSFESSTAQPNLVHSSADTCNSSSQMYPCSSTVGSDKLGADVVIVSRENISENMFSTRSQDKVNDAFLTRTNVIQNWVPESIEHKGRNNLDPDDASIDQFFECFEGMRSSQMNSGSGIWNWTCSVFNAITFASTLASGSDHVPQEQLVEKTLRAAISEICVVLSFSDEEQKHLGYSSNVLSSLTEGKKFESYMSCLSSMHNEQSASYEANTINPKMHHLEARFQNVFLDLETYPQNLKFKASVRNIKVDEYYDIGNHAADLGLKYKNASYYSILLSQHLQTEIQAALPPFPFHVGGHDSKCYTSDDVKTATYSSNPSSGLVKVELLKSFDECNCQYAVGTTELDGRPMTLTSISVILPPFIFWVHFHLIYMLLDLIKQVKYPNSNIGMKFASSESHNSSTPADAEGNNMTEIPTIPPKASMKVNVVFSQTRIVVSFPSEFERDFSRPSPLDKFIIFDHSSYLKPEEISEFPSLPEAKLLKDYQSGPSTSIHLDMKNFDIYLVESTYRDSLDDKLCNLERQTFSGVKILSVNCRGADDPSGISMIWQKGPVTGPWMASRAWSLSTLHDQKNSKKVYGEGTGFSSATTSEDLQEMSSNIRQELIQSSEFLVHVQFFCVSIYLGKNDYELLNHLLELVLDGLSNTDADPCNNSKDGESTSSNHSAIQTTVCFECDILNVCTNLDKVVEVSHLLQRELEGSWKRLKLNLETIELLSVSNIGGIGHAGLLWVNHGQGKLWGSIINSNEKDHQETEEFLLVVCSNSALGRGDGEGANAFSFGKAGSSVTHMWNPRLCQSYTSVVVRSGTIIAPGGRLDWISAISLFFSLPSQKTEQSGHDGMQGTSKSNAASNTSFFLDLVDIALSYEPHVRNHIANGEAGEREPSFVVEPGEEMDKHYVACLLAAASFSLCNHTNSITNDHNIQLQDLGLLICESSGSENVNCGYDVDYLCQTGYVKVAQNTLVEAVLRIRGSFWELEISDSLFNLDTCHDTTHGLFRLIDQLQQLYAPDVKDALIHLQSRWNSIQQANEEHMSTDTLGKSGSSNMNKLLMSDEGCRSVGLLDEILENAFYIKGECVPCDHCNTLSHPSCDGFKPEDGQKISITTQTTNDICPLSIPHENSLGTLGEQILTASEYKSYLPQIIDAYCVPNLPNSSLTSCSQSTNENQQNKLDQHASRDMECGKGGWYNDGSCILVENHISKMNSQLGGEQSSQEKNFGFGSSHSFESGFLKGKVLLRNIDVRWRMFAGVDWSKPRKNPMCCLNSNGRDGSSYLELIIMGLSLQYDMYPDGEVHVSKLSLSAQDMNLYDRSRDAPWKMILGCYNSKDYPRKSYSKALRLELETVRPDPQKPLEDYRLQLEILPLRLHLDQDQLNFLVSFFSKDSDGDDSHSMPHDLNEPEMSGRDITNYGSQMIVEEALLPFFQKFDIRPLVVRVDYVPRHFDPVALSKGNYAELLNLVPWKGIDLQLKHVSAVGVYGWRSICETVAGEWLEDISHNQVHKLLKGLAPMRSLFSLSSGTSKLISLPVKSYKKDRKLLKGMQRGAVAFVRSISIEAVGLGVHLVAGAHDILLKTEYILTTIPPSLPTSKVNKRKTNVRSNPPEDAQQGIKQAYESLSDGLGRTASALLGTPLKVYQRGAGAGSALATAFCAAPAAAIAPVSATARAMHCTLLGLRNSLDPEHKRESMDKYLGPSR